MDRLVYAPSVIVLVRQIMTIATYYDYERTTVLAQNQAYVPQASDNAPIDALEAFLSFFHSSHPPPFSQNRNATPFGIQPTYCPACPCPFKSQTEGSVAFKTSAFSSALLQQQVLTRLLLVKFSFFLSISSTFLPLSLSWILITRALLSKGLVVHGNSNWIGSFAQKCD